MSQLTSSPAESIARALGCRGPVETLASACSAAARAIGSGLAALRSGEVDVVLCGGADGLCELTYAGFNSLRAVSPEPCRPFRRDRDGLSLGEGAAILILERRGEAEARGVSILGTLLGAGASCDAHHMTAPDPEGRGPARAMQAALADAQRSPESIDFVNAHGTGTLHNDAAEAAALPARFSGFQSRLFECLPGSIQAEAIRSRLTSLGDRFDDFSAQSSPVTCGVEERQLPQGRWLVEE